MKIFKINAKWDYNYTNTLTAITLDKEWDRKKEKLLYAFIMFCAGSEMKNFLDGGKIDEDYIHEKICLLYNNISSVQAHSIGINEFKALPQQSQVRTLIKEVAEIFEWNLHDYRFSIESFSIRDLSNTLVLSKERAEEKLTELMGGKVYIDGDGEIAKFQDEVVKNIFAKECEMYRSSVGE